MIMKMLRRVVTTAITAAALAVPISAYADRAVVVGVNEYPDLLSEFQLEGCVNDAFAMRDALHRYGYEVTLLRNGEATRQGIISALAKMKQTCKPGERFVFYFAGHGNQNGFLLPSDANMTREKNALKVQHLLDADTLNKAVRDIPARCRVIVLDSCFAGSLIKSVSGLRARFASLPLETDAPPPGPSVKKRDGLDDLDKPPSQLLHGPPPPASSGVIYVTAAIFNQPAHETGGTVLPGSTDSSQPLSGPPHGVFTAALTKELDGKEKSWGEIQQKISTAMSVATGDTQKPQFSSGIENKLVLDNKPYQKAPRNQKGGSREALTVWNEYNEDHHNPDMLTFTMDRDLKAVHVEEEFDVTLTAGRDGYVVILDRDQAGIVSVVYLKPQEGQKLLEGQEAEAGKVKAKTPFHRQFKAKPEGTERLRAIFFTTRESAQALINAIPKKGLELPLLAMKGVEDVTDTGFYTADLFLQVVPQQVVPKQAPEQKPE